MQTIAITGASAGTGRAAARLFAARGDRIGLIARGYAGLAGAVNDVAQAGGMALAVSADVTDYGQVEAAAQQIEETLGPIDVWVNAAFSSVFASFAATRPEEFRRVTEVTYLGFVYGTMAALARMRPRDRGVIVQVGSALGDRSIPLQAAYCGSKQYFVGASTAVTILANRVAPAPLDRYLAKTGYHSQQTGSREDPDWPDNPWRPIDEPRGEDHGAHGKSHSRSVQMFLSHHPVATAAAGAATAATGVALAGRALRK